MEALSAWIPGLMRCTASDLIVLFWFIESGNARDVATEQPLLSRRSSCLSAYSNGILGGMACAVSPIQGCCTVQER